MHSVPKRYHEWPSYLMLGVRGFDVLLEVGVVVECHPALVTHHVLGLQVNLDQGYHYIRRYSSTTISRILLYQNVHFEVGVVVKKGDARNHI